MKIILRGLWPTPARIAAKRHNTLYHDGKPTAHIDVDGADPIRLGIPPRYKVWCPVCK